MVRVRIAPSPTGENLHIGNVYTALINYAFAHKNKGKFVVRVEDTDRTRFVHGSEERILDSMKWFGLQYDEGPDIGGPYAPYRQSDRKDIYGKYAIELVEKGKAYYCFCTAERLKKMREGQIQRKENVRYDGFCKKYTNDDAKKKAGIEPCVIRLNVPQNGLTRFHDLIHGDIEFENRLLDDQVLLKSDGFPTYHLGVVVDDHLMQISHIIRAEEWISSTPKHVLLYNAFEWKLPIFAHTPILRNPDKSKFSKRKNPVWASWYRDEGFLPQAILNYLALMGWSHPEGKEIFSVSEFTKVIRLEDIKPVGPIFDLEKLKWMNGEYIRMMTNQELYKKLLVFFHSTNDSAMSAYLTGNDKKFIDKVIGLVKTRIKTLKEIKSFYLPLMNYEPEFSKKSFSEVEKQTAYLLKKKFQMITSWNKEIILDEMREVLNETKTKGSTLYKILTGKDKGLPLPEMLELLGKEETISRLCI